MRAQRTISLQERVSFSVDRPHPLPAVYATRSTVFTNCAPWVHDDRFSAAIAKKQQCAAPREPGCKQCKLLHLEQKYRCLDTSHLCARHALRRVAITQSSLRLAHRRKNATAYPWTLLEPISTDLLPVPTQHWWYPTVGTFS